MKAPVAFPFLRPTNGRLSALWSFKPIPNANWQVPDWDVNTPVAFTVVVNIDHEGVQADCQLGKEVSLGLSAVWHSKGTTLRGMCQSLQICPTNSDPEEFILSAELAPNELAGAVEISVLLHLTQPGARSSALAPKLVGSVLWRDSRTITLEGIGSRFPIEARNFSADSRLPANAAWHLEWEPDSPAEMFMGTVRLLMNDSHPTIHAHLRGEPLGAANDAISSFIKFDVASQLVSGMLSCEEFRNGSTELPPGSVGRHVRELLGICFPGETMESLAQRKSLEEARFLSQLQHAMRFLDGVGA